MALLSSIIQSYFVIEVTLRQVQRPLSLVFLTYGR